MSEQALMRNPVVVLREEFDDWAVLFNPDTAEAVGINPVGVAVWKLIDGHRDLGGIIDEVKQLFDGVPDNVSDDIVSFTDDLTHKGFVALGSTS